MTFAEYWANLAKSYGAKSQFSRDTGIAVARLSSIANGRVKIGYKTAILLERATHGACRRKELAPHLEW